MLHLHVSSAIIDQALENLPEIVAKYRELHVASLPDYILLRKLSTLAGIQVSFTSEDDIIARYVSLLQVRESGKYSQEHAEQVRALRRAIRDTICRNLEYKDHVAVDSSRVISALMLRLCTWETTVKILFKLYYNIKRDVYELPLSETLPLVWIFSKYHLHSLALEVLKRALKLRSTINDLDILRLASLILFGILDFAESPFGMYTLKIHDLLRYFSWLVLVREPPLAKKQEFLLIFESSGRPCLLSNAQYVSDQARLSLSPDAFLTRIRDHIFIVKEEKFNIVMACATDTEEASICIDCPEGCVLKSRDIDARLSMVNQCIYIAPEDALVVIGKVNLIDKT